MHKEQNGRTKIHHTKDIQSTRLIQIQKPRGHKEERASFPDQFQYKVSKIHSPKSYSKERKGEEETDRKNARGDSAPRLGNRKVSERERGDLPL